MENYSNFAFGKSVKKVEQKDRTAKKVFVLGVYASAVHAKWVSADGLYSIRALAVDSEPEIFWKGNNAAEIIKGIEIPDQAGKLETANIMYNGPSGRTLDDCILKPLDLYRKDVWLSDLIPYSLKNEGQEKALRKLEPILQMLNLPTDTRTKASTRKIDSERVEEIFNEIKLAKAELIITLGNKPIKYFINYFDKSFTKLTHDSYGQILPIIIEGTPFRLLPLVHPRHVEGMSGFSSKWKATHKLWLNTNPKVL